MGGIIRLTAEDARARLDDLVELVRDSVASGASVGSLASLTPDETAVYWDGVLAEVEAGTRLLMVAEDDDGGVAGMV
jgi:acetyltransferase